LKKSDANRDRKFLLWLVGASLLLITVISVLAPSTADNDPRPTSYNTGPDGAKAAYLMFDEMGRETVRWTQPIGEMSDAQAARTTLIVAEPTYRFPDLKAIRAQVEGFLKRGGHVVTTGHMGALLLPGGAVKAAQMTAQGLCFSTPKDGRLSAAGSVEILDDGQWDGKEPGLEVGQRCGDDAVVVQFPFGKGEAVWWSSPTPLTNAGLKRDENLRLLLLSVGEGRAVAFDEGLRGEVRTFWEEAKGLPLWWMLGQFGLVFALLVLSFGRRSGPVREPVGRPRSSPVEFAESMGDLYEKAGATGAATEAARRRLVEVLRRDAGLSREVLVAGAESVAEALTERFGGDWSGLRMDLEEARATADVQASARSALVLVKALREDAEKVRVAAGVRVAAAVSVGVEDEVAVG
jgi:Domain of unknown function (DUF4350)